VSVSRKTSLSDALRQASGKTEPPRASAQPSSSGKTPVTPGRRGKKTIAGFFDPAASRQLRQMALEEGSNVQELLREAINDLFEKRGKSRIA
jgi:hypothetical protein